MQITPSDTISVASF